MWRGGGGRREATFDGSWNKQHKQQCHLSWFHLPRRPQISPKSEIIPPKYLWLNDFINLKSLLYYIVYKRSIEHFPNQHSSWGDPRFVCQELQGFLIDSFEILKVNQNLISPYTYIIHYFNCTILLFVRCQWKRRDRRRSWQDHKESSMKFSFSYYFIFFFNYPLNISINPNSIRNMRDWRMKDMDLMCLSQILKFGLWYFSSLSSLNFWNI